MKKLYIKTVSLIVVGLFNTGLFAQTDVTLELNPTDDSYVRGGSNGDKNYGDETEIRIKYSANDKNLRRAFLKFDLDLDNVDDIDMVSSAVLRLYASQLSEPLDVTLHQISDNSWEELTITGNNAPTFGAEMDTVNINATDMYFEWDVQTYIENKITNNVSLVSFALQHPGNTTEIVRFISKDSIGGINKKPELKIVYSPTLNVDDFANQTKNELKAKVFPNPVKTNNLTLSYEIGHDSDVSLGIFSIEGRLISQPIHKEYHSTGTYSKSINMDNMRNGIYFLQFLSNNNQRKTLKLIVNK